MKPHRLFTIFLFLSLLTFTAHAENTGVNIAPPSGNPLPVRMIDDSAAISMNPDSSGKAGFIRLNHYEETLPEVRIDHLKADTDGITGENERLSRQSRVSWAYEITKDSSTDYRTAVVGSEMTFRLTVKDEFGQLAEGVEMVFSVHAGGGNITGGTSANVTTGVNGVAEMTCTLGTETGANPVALLEAGQNPQQAGLNIIDVFPAEEPDNTVVFYAYGEPGPAEKFYRKYFYFWGSLIETPLLSPVIEVGVIVRDEYENPVSNIPITISPGEPKDWSASCSVSNTADNKDMLLVPADELPCDNNTVVPPIAYEQFSSEYTEKNELMSRYTPVSWWVYSGGMPNTKYFYKINAAGIKKTYDFTTEDVGNCDGESPPDVTPCFLTFFNKWPEIGNTTTAYVWLYSIREESEETEDPCEECTEDLIGTRRFFTDGSFEYAKCYIEGKRVYDVSHTDYGYVFTKQFTTDYEISVYSIWSVVSSQR